MKILRVSILFLVLIFVCTACFFRKEVQTSEVGLELTDGVSVSQVHEAGRYSSTSWYAELVVIDVSNKTVEWLDPALVTSDKQPISLKLRLIYSRCREESKIRGMFNNFRLEAFDDASLTTLVYTQVPSVAKTVTTKFTLDQMLGISEGDEALDRQAVEAELFRLLEPELSNLYVCLLQVTIADIDPGEEYLASLTEKAQALIQREVAVAETETLRQKLEQEKAQTNIDLERARRENLVNEELAKAYELSPELVDIRKLELLGQVLDENDLVIYVPEGSDISNVLLGNGTGGVLPIPEN